MVRKRNLADEVSMMDESGMFTRRGLVGCVTTPPYPEYAALRSALFTLNEIGDLGTNLLPLRRLQEYNLVKMLKSVGGK